MAGIAGIYFKTPALSILDYRLVLAKMANSLTFNDTQERDIYETDVSMFAVVAPLGDKVHSKARIYRYNAISVAFEGLVFVSNAEKMIMRSTYDLRTELNDSEYLPYVYDFYRLEFPHHITGQFNIFISDTSSGYNFLVNDRFGFLPMYIYETENCVIFSSKIESLISSGFVINMELDYASVAEHLYFNYVISENTFIKGITTLVPSSVLTFEAGSNRIQTYWSFHSLLDVPLIPHSDSFEAINTGIQEAVSKVYTNYQHINFSLTGGWDSRLLLSYLMGNFRDKISLYSFGAAISPDILIPQMIAEKEDLRYNSILLEDNYLNSDFLSNAHDTIFLSNGTRHYKRAHYLYAMKSVYNTGGLLFSGIFGDEVLKLGKPQSCGVISAQIIDMIDSSFSADIFVNRFRASSLSNLPVFQATEVIDELRSRIDKIREDYSQYGNITHQYYAFRFMNNLRKYFGSEVNSYSDFVDCYSPFIDSDFLNVYACTQFAGFRYPYAKATIKQKQQTTDLYTRLVMKNYPPLAAYKSDRGYSMRDTMTLAGKLRILSRRFISKQTRKVDAFNTKPTDKLFQNKYLNRDVIYSKEIAELLENSDYESLAGSLMYWIEEMFSKYSSGAIE